MTARALRQSLLQVEPVRSLWGAVRRGQLIREYRSRRDRYASEAAERGLVYSLAGTISDARRRLMDRGYSPPVREFGSVHTFAFIPDIGWHSTLLPDLELLGPVTRFDYVSEGFDVHTLFKRNATSGDARKRICAAALAALREANRRRAVDWVFVYAGGAEVDRAFMLTISEELGIPIVGMCLDDKQSWEGPRVGGQRHGQVDIADAFDLSWTSSRMACDWYLVEGARPVYLPEGFNLSTCGPRDVKKDIPVSFVGSAYGFRPAMIRHLSRHGIDVETYGAGWNDGATVDDQVAIFNRSQINLGMGGIGYSPDLTNVKGRDFEVPATGGGVYITSYNADLAQHFAVGREILCYRSVDDLVDQLLYYLNHSDEAMEISRAGRERCLKEHRWLHRYGELLRILGVMPRLTETC